MGEIEKIENIAREIRVDVMRMLTEAGSGHTAGAMGTADLFASLYFGDLLRYKQDESDWEERDRLVLSCGHYAPVLYATLAKAGFFPEEELKTLRKVGSRLQGHTVHFGSGTYNGIANLPGVEVTAGPLGQGVSVAVGMAIAGKMDKKNYRVVVVSSDGEQQEGQTWEAWEMAGMRGLDNLMVFIDMNNIQISGKVVGVMKVEPMKEKMEAFGFEVMEIDGNKIEEIIRSYRYMENLKGKPKAILMKTISGKGVSFMEGKYEWHGKPPSKEEAELAIKELS